MPREKECFRDVLDRLTERFPGKEAIPLKEASELVDSCERILKEDKTFPTKKLGGKYIVPLVSLARWLA